MTCAPIAHSLILPTSARSGLCLGEIVQLQVDGTLLVRLFDRPGPPVQARLATPHHRDSVLAAMQHNQPAVVAHVDGSELPIVLSFIVDPASLSKAGAKTSVQQWPDRVVLRAGPATMTLHSNGKITLRGVRVVTRAKRDCRLVGRTVRIN